ncbi:hypothetical protein HPB51_015932 [Rhipicephalus microplus]|uniref:ubiquitinyl hydrolase 1 n=1 Tax=Rhipicephalus microplus TaxID=6941 RepID=A0A9J6DHU0_RHIMP|nr:hypothetical protein HPB51_015932 [Rhipicephalus microplus]
MSKILLRIQEVPMDTSSSDDEAAGQASVSTDINGILRTDTLSSEDEQLSMSDEDGSEQHDPGELPSEDDMRPSCDDSDRLESCQRLRAVCAEVCEDNMVKKKKKHQEDPADDILDSSSDEVGDAAEGGSTTCSHQRSSVGLRRLRQQVLRNPVRLDVCDDCEDGEAQPETWLCLQCGHRGCGGTAKHGVRHSETPRSDSHALALSGQTLQLWCFPCNNWVEANPQVTQIVQNLKKKMASSSKKAKAAVVQVEGEEPAAETNGIDGGGGDIEEQKVPQGTWTAVKGLSNLGNTCYFNAVLQGLGQTPLLQPLLAKRCASKLECTFDPGSTVEGSETPELGSLNVELPGPGPLTSALALFLQELRMGSPHPRALFSKVCQVAPHFRGHQQHDSHELLRHLLEGVRAEEVKSTGSTMARILLSQREDFVVIWHLFGHHVGSKLLAGTPEEPVVSLLADERPEAVGCDDLTTRSCLATSPTDEPLRGRPGRELIPLSLATFDCRHLLDSIVWFASSLRRTSTTSGKSGGTTLRDGTGPGASKVDPNKVEPDTKAKIQAYKKAVARTPLDDIFGGILLSTIICQQCGKWLRYLAAEPQAVRSDPGCGGCIFDGGENAVGPCAQIWVRIKQPQMY